MLLSMLAVASVSPTGRTSDAALVATLKRLARDVELVLFCDRNRVTALVKRLRAALPRHSIVSLIITLDAGDPVPPEVPVIDDLLNNGVLPVVVFPEDTDTTALLTAMRKLANVFNADEVLSVNPRGVATVLAWDRPQSKDQALAGLCPI